MLAKVQNPSLRTCEPIPELMINIADDKFENSYAAFRPSDPMYSTVSNVCPTGMDFMEPRIPVRNSGLPCIRDWIIESADVTAENNRAVDWLRSNSAKLLPG